MVIHAVFSRQMRVAMVAALQLGRRELHRSGRAVPPELDALVSALMDPSGLEWTTFAAAAEITDGEFMNVDDAARNALAVRVQEAVRHSAATAPAGWYRWAVGCTKRPAGL